MLGDTFMRNYYTVFNFAENTVSLAPNSANSWANGDQVGSHLSGAAIMAIVLACLVLVVAISCVMYKCYLNKLAHSKTLGARAEAMGYTKGYDSNKIVQPI
jgi:hypothetical protein